MTLLFNVAAALLALWAFSRLMRRPQFWFLQIRAFEKADRVRPPPPGGIVFTGSSSIRFWHTLAHDMQPLPVINRGFGGSQLAHVSYYAQRIIIPYRPRAVVLYAGDNDLSIGRKTPQEVLQDLQHFVRLIQASLPQTWIYFVSIKPSPGRPWAPMDQANRLIAAYLQTQERVQLIDVSSAMLDAQGHARPELYGWDRIHMNASGYAIWTSIIQPVLLARFAES